MRSERDETGVHQQRGNGMDVLARRRRGLPEADPPMIHSGWILSLDVTFAHFAISNA